MGLLPSESERIIRVWRVTLDGRDAWVFDDLDVCMVFVRAEITHGVKSASIASEWMDESAYQALTEEDGGR